MVQSVERAFAILGAVARGPAGLTPIASRLSLPKSTVSRMLETLEGIGAVERLEGPRWRVGPQVAAIASGLPAELHVAAVARPYLVELVHTLGEDAGLALPDGYGVHYVEQAESDHPVQVRDWTGTRAPMHAVPSGLVLLAEWPPDALEAYLARDLERLTPRTLVRPGALQRRLAEVRSLGHAWGLEEFAEGINSVAAPVRDPRGRPIAAVHVHGPAYRFPAQGQEARIAADVVRAAAAVGSVLAT
jgi:DNA-binding IclR family transcriptional regulator